jgi:hypothetical protein
MSAPYELRFAIRILAINASTWTDLQGPAAIPISCQAVIVYNNSNVNVDLRTDPLNANSQIVLQPGESFQIGMVTQFGVTGLNGGFRFSPTGPPLCSFLSTSGNVNLIIESIQ